MLFMLSATWRDTCTVYIVKACWHEGIAKTHKVMP